MECPPQNGPQSPSQPPSASAVPAVPAVLFRANCTHCRSSFELDAAALRLAIGASSRTTFYSFTCPECGEAVRKPAGSGSSSCSPAAGSPRCG